MCGPPGLALGAAIVTAAGQVVGGLQANAQAKYESRIAQRNADIKREELELQDEATKREALNHYRRVAQLKGEQRAHAAGGNVSTDFGTAAYTLFDTDMLAREDAEAIYGQGHQNMKGIDLQVANHIAESRAAKSRGKAALVQAGFGAASSVLGGISQYKKLSLNYGAG